MLIAKKCRTCGIEFFRPRSAVNKISFCSQYCRVNNETVISKRDREAAFKESRKREFTKWLGKRRHSKMLSGHKIDPYIVYDLFKWVCIVCDQSISKDHPENHPESVSLEHVIPLSKGGTHTWFNVGPAHTRCNAQKNDIIDMALVDKVFNLWLNV